MKTAFVIKRGKPEWYLRFPVWGVMYFAMVLSLILISNIINF